MESIHRRTFHRGTLSALTFYGLLETLFERELFAENIRPIAAGWLKRVHELSLDLRGKKLEAAQWQAQVEALHARIDLPDMLRFLNFEKIAADKRFNERGERSIRPALPEVEGLPRELTFGRQIFALRKDRSVVPHGHNNMATSFLVLRGEFHGRHYDRLEDEPRHLIIRPTIDDRFGPDRKDNIHWFKTLSDTGHIFNMHVLNVDPDFKGRGGRVYVDPDGETLADGRIRAPRVTHRDVLKRYG